MSYKKYLKKLYIITPFKDKNLNALKKTIKSLSNNKSNIIISQLIIYDKSCEKLLRKFHYDIKNLGKNNYYFNRFVPAKTKGIYSAINEGLDLIPLNSYYVVIGAGDLFVKTKSPISYPKNNIIFFPYKLSSSRDMKYIKKIRSIYGGMPYCHNAIAYINDGSKYECNYKISADYDHFLKYIKNYNLNNQDMVESLQEVIFIEFESQYGLSSKSRIYKNFENIIIIYRFFGFSKIILYFLNTFNKIIDKVWKET